MIPDRPGRNDDSSIATGVWITGLLGFLVCLITVAVWGSNRIRPLKIDDESILLGGVSDEFADEAKKLRDGPSRGGYGDYDDRESRRKPARGRYEDDDRDDDRRRRDDDDRD